MEEEENVEAEPRLSGRRRCEEEKGRVEEEKRRMGGRGGISDADFLPRVHSRYCNQKMFFSFDKNTK